MNVTIVPEPETRKPNVAMRLVVLALAAIAVLLVVLIVQSHSAAKSADCRAEAEQFGDAADFSYDLCMS